MWQRTARICQECLNEKDRGILCRGFFRLSFKQGFRQISKERQMFSYARESPEQLDMPYGYCIIFGNEQYGYECCFGTALLFLSPCIETGGQKQKDRPQKGHS